MKRLKGGAGKTDLALWESEERYRRLLDDTDTGIVVLDGEGLVLLANEPFLRVAGAERAEDVIGHSVLEWTAPDERENNARAIALCARQGFVKNFETVYQRGDGTRVNVLISASVQESPDGRMQIASFCRDITQIKEAEGAVMKFDRLFHGSPIPMAVNSLPEPRFTDVNDAFLDAHGYTRDEVIGHTAAELGLFAEPRLGPQMEQELRTRGRVTGLEIKVARRDGTIFDGLLSSEVIECEGQPCTLTVVIDQSERTRAEVALRESEEKFRSAFMTGPDAIYIAELDGGRILEINQFFEDIFGYTREEVIGKTLLELSLFPDPSQPEGVLSELKAKGSLSDYELNMRRKSGEVLTVSLSVSTLSIGDQRHSLGVVRDITERKAADRALRESQDRYKTLVNLSPDAILVNSGGKYVFANPAAARLFGAGSPGELVGMHVAERVHPDYREFVAERTAHVWAGGTTRPAEIKFLRLDGTSG